MQQVVKKMHGLNTIQAASFGPTFFRNLIVGQSTSKVYHFYTVDAPADLSGGLFNGESATSTKEFWVKRYYNVYHFVNTISIPCMMQVTKLLCRTSLPANNVNTDVAAAMTQYYTDTNAAQLISSPYLSNTTSPSLHKWFKILSDRTWVMKPGKVYKLKQNIQRGMRNRGLQRIVEGSTSDYVLNKGSTVYFVQFYGVPYYAANDASPYTTLGPVRVITLNKFYGSYYTMDDASDTNTVFNYLPTTHPVSVDNAFPTVYTMQKPFSVGADLDPHTLTATSFLPNSGGLSGNTSVFGTSASTPFHVTP